MKSRKFKSNTGYQIAIYLPNRPVPLYVPAGEPYFETADQTETHALMGCPEVHEVRESKPEPEQAKPAEPKHKAVQPPAAQKPAANQFAKGKRR